MLSDVIPLFDLDGEIVGFSLLDSVDAHLMKYRWRLASTSGYAVAWSGSRPHRRLLLLHREVLGLQYGDGVFGDHANGNRLDNRRANLRSTTRQGNAQNRRSNGARGVAWHKVAKKWQAQVKHLGRTHYLGLFDTREAAAEAASNKRRELGFLEAVT